MMIKRMQLLFAVFLCACAMMVLAPQAQAETITLTSGSVTVTRPDTTLLRFNFAGQNFSAAGQASSGVLGSPLSGTNAGDRTIFVNAATDVLFRSDVTFNGTNYSNFFQTGGFDIRVPLLEVPLDFGDSITLTSSFTFRGGISFFESDPVSSNPLFSLDLVGQGVVSVLIVRSNNFNGFEIQSVRYDFRPAAEPVPEPATLLLLGTGLTGVVARLRKRRRKTPGGTTGE